MGTGEDILGWNIVEQVAGRRASWLITHPANRPGIERRRRGFPLKQLRVKYVRVPKCFDVLLRWQGTFQVYAYLWQIWAYAEARRIAERVPVRLFHHVTYANDWMASYIGAFLKLPYVRGPCGGAQQVPKLFRSEFSLRDRLWERFRAIAQKVLRLDPVFVKGHGRASAILVCNQESLEALRPRWRDKVRYFPVNGVNESENGAGFEHGGPHTGFRVLSAGKLIHWKGFGLVIRSFAMLAATVPEAQLTILGDGPELPRLRALAQTLGCLSRIEFAGWAARTEAVKRMREADVFLYLSLREGGGAVVLEAMAAGKPVVCLDMGGPALHVTEECGIKIPPHSPDQAVRDAASALRALYGDAEVRGRMGAAARRRAKTVYGWDRLGDELMQIYQGIEHGARKGDEPQQLSRRWARDLLAAVFHHALPFWLEGRKGGAKESV
jgi:glycosyltransferase involved in cell wall biosynthesis